MDARVRRCAALFVLTWLLFASAASAHTLGISRSDFTLDDRGAVRALIVLSKADAVRLGNMDSDHDGVVSPLELSASEGVFREVLGAGVLVRADGARCSGGLEGGGDVEGDGFGFSLGFACAPGARTLEVELPFVDRLPPGHRHVARIVSGAASVERFLSATDRSVSLVAASGAIPVPRPPESRTGPAFLGAVALGIEHILGGWDHLLFLAALLLGTRELRSVIAAVSAFTVAHSITLAVAALGIYAPGPRWVEPAIAASIAFVAFENALRDRPAGRWRVTFAFGLVHGFGFAGALQALTFSRERLVPTLAGFNIGVEIGQLALVAIAVPILARLRRLASFETRWVPRVSIAMGAIGVVLFVFRVISLRSA